MTNNGLEILSGDPDRGVDLGRGTWHHVCFSAASGNDAIATVDGIARIRKQSTWPSLDLSGAVVAVGANLDNSVDKVASAKAWVGPYLLGLHGTTAELTEAKCGEIMNSGGHFRRTLSGAKLLPLLKWPMTFVRLKRLSRSQLAFKY